jgi:hypothetical protein
MVGRHRIAATFLLGTLVAAWSVHAQGVDTSNKWPDDREHLLAGHYIGQVRDPSRAHQPCEYLAADLDLRYSHVGGKTERTYTLAVSCLEDPSMNREYESTWWNEVIGGDCLVLQPELGPNPEHPRNEGHLFGFRIDDDANALYMDGRGCVSADERDNVELRRVPSGRPAAKT